MYRPQPFLFVVLTCVACGSHFEAAGSTGSNGGGGSGGRSGSDGGAAEAGESALGGDAGSDATAGSAGESTTGGQATGGQATGGQATGGAASGGLSAGGAAGADCDTLKLEYAALVKKARVCEKGATDECSPSSKAPAVGGCGCPTLVNAKSEYTAQASEKYDEIQKSNCDNGPVCQIACLPVTAATCEQSTGATRAQFVCTGVGAIAN